MWDGGDPGLTRYEMDGFASFVFEHELVVNGSPLPSAFGGATILEDVNSSFTSGINDFMIAIGGAVFLHDHSNHN